MYSAIHVDLKDILFELCKSNMLYVSKLFYIMNYTERSSNIDLAANCSAYCYIIYHGAMEGVSVEFCGYGLRTQNLPNLVWRFNLAAV